LSDICISINFSYLIYNRLHIDINTNIAVVTINTIYNQYVDSP